MTNNTLLEIPLIPRLREIQYSPAGRVDDGQWDKTIEEVGALQDRIVSLQIENKDWNEQCNAYELALIDLIQSINGSIPAAAIPPTVQQSFDKAYDLLRHYNVIESNGERKKSPNQGDE